MWSEESALQRELTAMVVYVWNKWKCWNHYENVGK